jgi:ribosomal protein S27E
LEKGDAQIIIFEKIDRQLKKQGYKLIFINNGNDSYIFTVVKKINYKNLLKIENIKFENIPVKDNIKPFIAEIKCNKCGKDHTLFLPWDGNIKCKNCGNLLYDPKDETTLKKCIIIKTY